MNYNKLIKLLEWFQWYDFQVSQYNRAKRLGIETNIDIEALDKQAEVNAKEIRKIRNE